MKHSNLTFRKNAVIVASEMNTCKRSSQNTNAHTLLSPPTPNAYWTRSVKESKAWTSVLKDSVVAGAANCMIDACCRISSSCWADSLCLQLLSVTTIAGIPICTQQMHFFTPRAVGENLYRHAREILDFADRVCWICCSVNALQALGASVH